MDINLWMKKAKQTIEKMPIGTVFVVKDLFDGVEWNALPIGDRQRFGKFFKNSVIEFDVESVLYNGKAANNSTKYIKSDNTRR